MAGIKPSTELNKDTRVFRRYKKIPPTAAVLDAVSGGNSTVDTKSLAATIFGTTSGTMEEFTPSYKPEFPYNTVLLESESGLLVEADDTPGAERFHIHHRSGTHIEMRPDGSIKYRTNATRQDVTKGNHELMVEGDCNITIEKGGYSLLVQNGDLVIESEKDASINIRGKMTLSANNIVMNATDKISLNAPNVDIGAINPGGRPMISLPNGITINEKFPADPTLVPTVNFPLSPAGKLGLQQALRVPNRNLESAAAQLSSATESITNATGSNALTEAIAAIRKTVSAVASISKAMTDPAVPSGALIALSVARALRNDAYDPSGEPMFSKLTEQPGELPLSHPAFYTSAQILGPGQTVGALSTPRNYQQLRGRLFDTPEDIQNTESYDAHINLSMELGDFTKEQKISAGRVLQSDTNLPAPEPSPFTSFPLPSGGVVTCTVNSREIRGVNTKFDEDMEVGDVVTLNGHRGVIAVVTSSTSALLQTPWDDSTSSGELRVYRLRPLQNFFGKFTYTDDDVLGDSGLHLRDVMPNFISPVIEVPQINVAMLSVSTGIEINDTGSGKECGTPAEIPSLNLSQFYDPNTMDLSTAEGCGKFVEAVIAGTGPEWGHIQKSEGQTRWKWHAVDAIMYKSPTPLYNGLFYQAVDIVGGAEAPGASIQFLPVCAPDDGSRWGGKG